MQAVAASVMEEGIAAVHEAMHDAEAPAPPPRAPPQLAPLPMLSQVADDSAPDQFDDAHAAAAQPADKVDTQVQGNHATAQSPGAAPSTQPSGTQGRLLPAPGPATVQSVDAHVWPQSACNTRMPEAPEDHAPSQQVDAVASSELGAADSAAAMQLMEELTPTQLGESTAITEPADMDPISDQAALSMQTDLPTSSDQDMPSADKHDQPQGPIAEVEPPETAQPPAQLQGSNAQAADVQQSAPMETVQSGVEHLAMTVAGSKCMSANGVLDTVATSAPGTVPLRQNDGPSDMSDPAPYGPAQHDTNAGAATSPGGGLTDHPMFEPEPVSSCLRPSKQTLLGAVGSQSDVRSEIATEQGEAPPNQPMPGPSSLKV